MTKTYRKYLRDEHNHPIGLIAYRWEPGNNVRVGYSLCSERDQPNKSLARRIAEGRLETKPIRLDLSIINLDNLANEVPNLPKRLIPVLEGLITRWNNYHD